MSYYYVDSLKALASINEFQKNKSLSIFAEGKMRQYCFIIKEFIQNYKKPVFITKIFKKAT